jgi:predicted nucleic acid-binding protein
MILVDTNVVLDVLGNLPPWSDWSTMQLRHQSRVHALLVTPVVYAELAASFESALQLESRLDQLGLAYTELPRQALFLAGHVHRDYRRAGGARTQVLADFFIGAHAAVLGCGIITRDARRYRSYFPRVPLVTP